MKKIIFPILVILVLALGAIFLFFSPEESAERPKDGSATPSATTTTKDRVIDYLEDSTLETNYGGEVFADYYRFGQEENMLFIWAYVSEYYNQDGEVELGSARSGPMMINIREDGVIADHWTPRDGEEYSESIKQKFPQEYQQEALDFHSQHEDVLNDLKESVKTKAKKSITEEDEEGEEEEESASNKERVLSVGETTTIRLEANATTGFKWQYTIEDEDIVEIVSDEYQEREHQEGMVGVGGERVLEIKGVEEGATTILFEYSRPWESKQPDKTKKIEIRVKEENHTQFDTPALDTEYIVAGGWDVQIFDTDEDHPQEVEIVDGQIECRGTSSPEMINDRQYCLKETSEGATGETYTDYTYFTLKSDRLVSITFVVRYSQCGNYDDPQRTECQNEREEFDPDQLARQLMKNVEF